MNATAPTTAPTTSLTTSERVRAMGFVVWDVALDLRRTYGEWPCAGDVLFWMSLGASRSFAARLVNDDDVAWLYAATESDAPWTDLLVAVTADGIAVVPVPTKVIQGAEDWLAYMATKGQP